MPQKTKTLLLSTLLLALSLVLFLLPSAQAASKPIAGRIIFPSLVEELEVTLFVEVDSPFESGTRLCLPNPLPQTGPDGSFSTNLENLVFQDFPSLKCNSFWQNGDQIWYRVTYRNQFLTSEKEALNLGTGLHFLNSLTLPSLPDDTPKTPAGAGGSSAGGGAAARLPPSEKDSKPAEETLPSSKENLSLKPDLAVNLSFTQQESLLQAQLSLKLLNNLKGDYSLKLIILSLPNQEIVHTTPDNFYLENTLEKNYPLDLTLLPDGWYKLQAFIYSQEELVSVSSPQNFFLRKNLLPEKRSPSQPLIEKEVHLPFLTLALGPFLYWLGLVLIIIATILFFKKLRQPE